MWDELPSEGFAEGVSILSYSLILWHHILYIIQMLKNIHLNNNHILSNVIRLQDSIRVWGHGVNYSYPWFIYFSNRG